MAQQGTSVNSVHRAFDVIEGLRELDEAGVTELARHVDLPASTVHNYLATLIERRYVIQAGNQYRLANRFSHLGDYVRQRESLYRVGQRHVRALADRTGETANLMIEEYGMGIYVMSVPGDEGLRNYSYIRRREHLHSTAAGKAILLAKEDADVESIIEVHGLPAETEHTITDSETLMDELARARERGYTLNDEENTLGIRAVGAPVTKSEGSVGAISLSGPVSHVTDTDFEEEYPDLVIDTARSIELELLH